MKNTKFKVGDRVKCIEKLMTEDELIIGSTHKIVYIENDGYWLYFGYKNDPYHSTHFQKIGGSMQSITKYDELKSRIEALQDGWTKEADDILQAVDKKGEYDIDISTRSQSSIWIHSHNMLPRGIVDFYYYEDQCGKLEAFKKALLWLLDHSDIKKDEKADKIKELEYHINKLEEGIKDTKRQIGELK